MKFQCPWARYPLNPWDPWDACAVVDSFSATGCTGVYRAVQGFHVFRSNVWITTAVALRISAIEFLSSRKIISNNLRFPAESMRHGQQTAIHLLVTSPFIHHFQYVLTMAACEQSSKWAVVGVSSRQA